MPLICWRCVALYECFFDWLIMLWSKSRPDGDWTDDVDWWCCRPMQLILMLIIELLTRFSSWFCSVFAAMQVTISGFDLNNFRSCLEKWNTAMENMYHQCLRVGSTRCLPIFYEQLVLHPEPMMRNILTFLDITWHNAVLHHEELINKPGGISLSQ